MELYKFINQTEIQKYKGSFVIFEDHIYKNPDENFLKKIGYKELKITNYPECDLTKERIEKKFIDGEVITLTYIINKN